MNLANTLLACGLLWGIAGVGAAAPGSSTPPVERRVFFGELHLHTELSLDAWTYGTRLSPDDAYRFGMGEPVTIPIQQLAREQGITGQDHVVAQRRWPLDFMAVTDHSENMGTMKPLDDPESALASSEFGQRIMADPSVAFMAKIKARRTGTEPPEALHDPQAMRDAWEVTIEAANRYYQPGSFTTFIGYEWSAIPNGRNLHRNVIFDADHAPLPYHADQSDRPEDLWTYLESVRKRGIEVLAIPHNSNVSGGLMFAWADSDGNPIDASYARRRAVNEPLLEIAQVKGQSETSPALSPNDEYADFELYEYLLGPSGTPAQPDGSYLRQGFGRGLVVQARTGVNPFQYGVAGASDLHNALSTSDEEDYAGGQFGIDADTMLPTGEAARKALGQIEAYERRPGESDQAYTVRRRGALDRGSGALTGVWAEANNRESIFAALKRRETFATSGSRIRLRMFASWFLEPRDVAPHAWLRDGYARGTPMGEHLPPMPDNAGAPWFIVEALKDPAGANLDRIQIVKVWLDGETYREKIFDVALSDGRVVEASGKVEPVGNTVNLKTATYTNGVGAPYLAVTWQDPEFDPDVPSVYYARVLEIPTPRWSTILAVKNRMPIPEDVPATIQERAWSSPIWYALEWAGGAR